MEYTASAGYQKGRKKIMLAIDQTTYDKLEAIKPSNLSIQECIRQMIGWGLDSEEELLWHEWELIRKTQAHGLN